jgi:hypothetical protein
MLDVRESRSKSRCPMWSALRMPRHSLQCSSRLIGIVGWPAPGWRRVCTGRHLGIEAIGGPSSLPRSWFGYLWLMGPFGLSLLGGASRGRVVGVGVIAGSTAMNEVGGSGVFVEAVARRRRRPRREAVGGVPLLRFAFYGRMSTEEYQDRVTSLSWQREVAAEMIGGRGAIVVEFFDEGVTRRLSWWERPAAAALLAAVCDPGRGFEVPPRSWRHGL